MRSCSAAFQLFVAAGAAWGQVTSVPADRAPATGGGELRAALTSIAPSDPIWGLAAVPGVPAGAPAWTLARSNGAGPQQIGVNHVPPGGPIRPTRAGVARVEENELVWRVRVDSPRAGGVRLNLNAIKLAPGGSLVVAGTDGGYVVQRVRETWTPVLSGSSAYVEYRGPIAAGLPSFEIAQVASISPEWSVVSTREFPCEVDVQCQTVDPVARDSVALIVYSTPIGTFACSGGLLNDTDPSTTIGWLLTANQAINTPQAAASVSAYWFYQTPACNGQAPSLGSVPVSQGATLAVTSASTNVSLLRLDQDPTAGQGLAGWTTIEPLGSVSTIHHPIGTPKRFAQGAVTQTQPICFGSRSFYQYHYLDYTIGITEDGSLGAPLFNAQWQVVGQMAGLCVTAPPTCANPNQWNATYGKFSRSFPLLSNSLTGTNSPARVYVNAAATGAGTGLTWADAYTTLDAALLAACPGQGGMEVWVARGTYKPGGVGSSRESAFQLVSGVRVYGGFAGTESNLTERDFVANATILSGDLAGDDGPNFANRTDNSYHVIRATGVDSGAVLDGFVIKGGSADGAASFNDKGGGLYIESGSPRIENCTFEDNRAGYSGGGAAVFFDGITDFRTCTFRANRAVNGAGISVTAASGAVQNSVFESNAATVNGGAVDLYQSGVQFQSCVFKLNTASGRGGGAFMTPSALPAFTLCRFESNSASLGGGGLATSHVNVTVDRCVFLGNSTAFFGGGMLQTDGASTVIKTSRFLGNTCGDEGGGLHANASTASVTNCEFSGNRSTGLGGGGLWANEGASVSLLGCTVTQNAATNNGGGLLLNVGTYSIADTIIWGNSDAAGVGESSQVRVIAGTVGLSYSLVQGLTGALGGTGNIGGDPLFIAPMGPDTLAGTEDDDLTPGGNSPAIDAGDSTPWATVATDIRGNTRQVDNTCIPDTGTGPQPIVDMGAIEVQGCACYPNCDLSTAPPTLNINDFICFINKFASGTSYANCDGSTAEPVLNINDFICFLNRFAAGCT